MGQITVTKEEYNEGSVESQVSCHMDNCDSCTLDVTVGMQLTPTTTTTTTTTITTTTTTASTTTTTPVCSSQPKKMMLVQILDKESEDPLAGASVNITTSE